MKNDLSKDVDKILTLVNFLKIDGKLSYYNGYFYVPIKNQKDLEAIIFQNVPTFYEEGNIRQIKKCAEVIYNYYSFQDIPPAEKDLFLGLNDGILFFTSVEEENPWKCVKVFPIPYDKRNDQQHSEQPLSVANTSTDNVSIQLSRNGLQQDLSQRAIQITHLINANVPATVAHAPSEFLTPIDSDFFKFQSDAFFAQIAGNDPVLVDRIWEVLACILVPDPSIKSFFLLQGVSDSGKSVFGRFVTSLFYRENVRSLDLDRLGDRYSASVLPGAYLNVSMDLPDRILSAKTVATLKMLTGDDEISIEGKSTDVQSFKNRSRFLFGSNYSIRLSDYDEAFIKRLITIPFRISVDKSNQDPYLFDKLYRERDYVVWKAVCVYYPKIKSKNFKFSGSRNPIYAPKVSYPNQVIKEQECYIQEFANQNCLFTKDIDKEIIRKMVESRKCEGIGINENWVGTYSEDLYKAYIAFCKKKGVNTIDQKQFTLLFGKLYSNQVEHTKWRCGDKNQHGFLNVLLAIEGMDFSINS